jgi:hypothetical protein
MVFEISFGADFERCSSPPDKEKSDFAYRFEFVGVVDVFGFV